MGGIDGILALPGVAETPAGKNKRIVCDRIYMLKDGKIHSCGEPRSILTRDLILDVFNFDIEKYSNFRSLFAA